MRCTYHISSFGITLRSLGSGLSTPGASRTIPTAPLRKPLSATSPKNSPAFNLRSADVHVRSIPSHNSERGRPRPLLFDLMLIIALCLTGCTGCTFISINHPIANNIEPRNQAPSSPMPDPFIHAPFIIDRSGPIHWGTNWGIITNYFPITNLSIPTADPVSITHKPSTINLPQ